MMGVRGVGGRCGILVGVEWRVFALLMKGQLGWGVHSPKYIPTP
jgi:hypothetical protein